MTGVKAVALEDGGLRCEQEVAGGRDVYRVPLPAVVTVKEGLNLPRYPSVPGPPAGEEEAGRRTDAGAGCRRASRRCASWCPSDEGTQTEVLGRGADAAPAVVELLEPDRGPG